jgi:alpha-1,6-mannosyltransferase
VLGSVLTVALPLPKTAPAITASIVAGVVGFLFLAWNRGAALPRAALIGALVVVGVASVAAPPRRSNDLWAYAAYGQMVVDHHANPYAHRPAEFPRDTSVERMNPGWRRARTVYGPMFTGLSAVILRVTGGRPLPTRLAFQAMAALSVAGCILLVARQRDGPLPALLLGLHPVVAVYVVNAGHNDALMALLVLGASVATGRRRFALAGVLLGLAVGIKAIAVLPGVVLVCWIWRRHGGRAGWTVAAVAGTATAVGYVAVGGPRAIEPLLAASRYHSRASIWQPLLHDAGRAPGHIGLVAALVALTLAVVLAAGHLGDDRPHAAVAAPLVAFVLAAGYVLPWYFFWAMPLLALDIESRATRVVVAVASLVLVAYQYPSDVAILDQMARGGASATRVAQVIGIGVLVVSSYRRLRPSTAQPQVAASR